MAKMEQYALLTGSDLGNRLANLKMALDLISQRVGKVLMVSQILETAPWGFEADTQFLNQAILVETYLNAHGLLDVLLEIEQEIGRIRASDEWTSRIIDIDILCTKDGIVNTDRLNIPHKFLHERVFALTPLNQIVDWKHPILKKKYSELEAAFELLSEPVKLVD